MEEVLCFYLTFLFPHYSQGHSVSFRCSFLVLAFCLKLVHSIFVLLNDKVVYGENYMSSSEFTLIT